MRSVFSPLAEAVMNAVKEGVLVLDPEGRVLYANEAARAVLDVADLADVGDGLMSRLEQRGARITAVSVDGLGTGKAVILPVTERGRDTLADRERQAILETLEASGWRLAETARRLGISRTTLWRRLKEYGLHRDGRGRWSRAS